VSRSKRNAAAEEYFKRAPNYSAEAIPDLHRCADQIVSRFPIASAMTRSFAAVLESAHKFVLPTGGRLFDGGVAPAMMEAFRLPFDQCVIEFDSPKDSAVEYDRFHSVMVPRRIVACLDMAKAAEFLRRVRPVPSLMDDVCLVWPIDFKDGRWTPSWCGALVPYNQEPVQITQEQVQEVRERLDRLGATDGRSVRASRWTFRATFVALGDLGQEVEQAYTAEEADYSAHVDTIEEITAAFQMCAALACANVTTEVIRPTREARAAKPASTLFDYHVLMIDPGKERHPSEDLGGTHASPRTHLRRGHIRRLAWGSRIWVNSCVVNPSATGTVNKDYAVRRKP